MKKNLIALAVAGALVVPMTAAANVTVFGTIQQEVVSYERTQNSGAAKTSRMGVIDGLSGSWNADNGSGPSTIGFRAVQDLGNGMKAAAVGSYNATSAGGALNNRDLYVNLDTGTAGTIWLGRFTTPYSTAGKDALNGTFMQARGNGGMNGGNSSLGNGGHLGNIVGYSNKFGPVSIVGGMVFDERDSGAEGVSAKNAYAIRAEMSLADIGVWVAATNADNGQLSDAQMIAGNTTKNNATKIGADYKFGDFRVMAQMENLETKAAAAATSTKTSFKMAQVSYTMGANTIVASLGQADVENSDADTTYMAVGVRHSFTRQVSVHAGYRATELKNAANTTNGWKDRAIGAGLRVGF